MGKEFIVNNSDDMCALMCDNNTEGLEANSMSKVILKVEVEEDYLESIKASTNKTSSDIILINATPITESDDAVSRQEVLKKLRGCLTGGEAEYRYVKLHIDSIHSVLPKREQGKWIEHPHECGDNWEFSKYECSICHMWEENDSNFCPNCGAEMR